MTLASGTDLIAVEVDGHVATIRLNRPVRWREDRAENLTSAASAREDSAEVEAAVTADGRILALRARLLSDFGAYSFFPANYMLRVVAMMLPAFGLAVDAIGRRWRVALPVVDNSGP